MNKLKNLMLAFLLSGFTACAQSANNIQPISTYESPVSIPYAERVAKFSEWFVNNSDRLDELLQENDNGTINAFNLMQKGVAVVGDNVRFLIGADHEICFSAEDDFECLYIYPTLVDSLPESIHKKWNIYPCKQPGEADFGFRMYGKDIDMAQIKVLPDYDSEAGVFLINFYHPVLAELSEDECYNVLWIILDVVLGEGTVYNYIAQVEKADNDNGMIPLVDLPGAIQNTVEAHDRTYSTTPQLEYAFYSCNPAENEIRLRFEILGGTTCFPTLGQEYTDGSCDIYNRLITKGVLAAMLIMEKPDNMTFEEFTEFRYNVMGRFEELFADSNVDGLVTGTAIAESGNAYIDLLLYNDRCFIEYLAHEAKLRALLALPDGTTCPIRLLFKTFDPASPVFLINDFSNHPQ